MADAHNPFGAPSRPGASNQAAVNSLAAARMASMRPVPIPGVVAPVQQQQQQPFPPTSSSAAYAANPFTATSSSAPGNGMSSGQMQQQQQQPSLIRAASFSTGTTSVVGIGAGQPHPHQGTNPSSSSSSQQQQQQQQFQQQQYTPYGQAPSQMPVARSLADYIQEYLNGPQAAVLSSSSSSTITSEDATITTTISAPAPLKMITYVTGLSVPTPEILGASYSSDASSSSSSSSDIASAPPSQPSSSSSSSKLPTIAEAVNAESQQQWQRLLELIPSATDMVATVNASSSSSSSLLSSSSHPTHLTLSTCVALARCRVQALLALRKPLQSATDSAVILGAILAHAKGMVAPSLPQPGICEALCGWLCLHGQAVASGGAWREAVTIFHGVLRFACGRLPSSLTSSTSAPFWTEHSMNNKTINTDSNSHSIFNSWAAAEEFSSSESSPIAEQALAYLFSSQSVHDALLSQLEEDGVRYRFISWSAVRCAGTLASIGYAVAARNTFTEALEVLDGLEAATVVAETPPLVTSPLIASSSSSSSFVESYRKSPLWLHKGLIICTQIQLLRAMGKEADASVAMNTLELTGGGNGTSTKRNSGWGFVNKMILTTTTALSSVAAISYDDTSTTTAPSPLPPPFTCTPDAFKDMTCMEIYAAAQICALRGASLAQSMRLQEAVPLFEAALFACGTILKQSGGTTSSSTSLDIGTATCGTVSGAIPEVLDIAAECVNALVDAIRRAPPASAQPPSSVALDLLHNVVRAQPFILSRKNGLVAHTLCTLVEAGRDVASAALAKRVIQGIANKYGMQHLDATAVFRLVR